VPNILFLPQWERGKLIVGIMAIIQVVSLSQGKIKIVNHSIQDEIVSPFPIRRVGASICY
jgi:hypothetical protein